MSFDVEGRVGQMMDDALSKDLGIYFDPDWHPSQVRASRRHKGLKITGWALGSAAAVLVALPLANPLHQAQRSTHTVSLAAPHVPPGVTRVLHTLNGKKISVAGMSPVYGTYPTASPTGQSIAITGHFSLGSTQGTSLSVKIDNHRHVVGGMLFNQGQPVYMFTGGDASSGTTISDADQVTPAKGYWYAGGAHSINAFSAAGTNVYVTHGNMWANLNGTTHQEWAKSPGNPPANTLDNIAGLPKYPNHALVLEENTAGQSVGYVTTNGGDKWAPWGLGAQSVTNLYGIGSHYWAIINGTLDTSSNGKLWSPMLSINTKRWQVQTYAVNPANTKNAVVALIPISGDGIGPVLETSDGGAHWARIPHFPAIGAAPSTMTMNSNGDISALINLDGPVVVRYSAKGGNWSVFPIPSRHNTLGLGQLAAAPNGNLVYGAPSGTIYQWIHATRQWLMIKPPSHVAGQNSSVTPLQTVGNDQTLAGYNHSWWIWVESSKEANPPVPSSKPKNALNSVVKH